MQNSQDCKTQLLKGTVQRKLTRVKRGINRKLMIWAWAVGVYFTL
jgi:hypothetical protein